MWDLEWTKWHWTVFLPVPPFPLSVPFHRCSTLTLIYPHVGLTRMRNGRILGIFQTAMTLPESGSLNGKAFSNFLTPEQSTLRSLQRRHRLASLGFHIQTVPTSNPRAAGTVWLTYLLHFSQLPLIKRPNFRPNSFQINIITLRNAQVFLKTSGSTQNSGRQNGGMQQIPFWRPTTFRGQHMKFIRPCCLENFCTSDRIIWGLNWVCESDSANKHSTIFVCICSPLMLTYKPSQSRIRTFKKVCINFMFCSLPYFYYYSSSCSSSSSFHFPEQQRAALSNLQFPNNFT